jgi:hypothetical protein
MAWELHPYLWWFFTSLWIAIVVMILAPLFCPKQIRK